MNTRSYAALWAADLDWIVGAGTFWGVLNVSLRPQLTFEMGDGVGAGINKNVTHAESQLTF